MPYKGEVGKLVIAFSGCGKTYFCKHNPNWLDLDVYIFKSFLNDADFAFNLSNILTWYKYNVFLNDTTYYYKLDNLKADYVILPERTMKNEIINRLIKRDSINDWIKLLIEDWDGIWNNYNNLPVPKIYLKPGQYISDIMDANGNIKENVQIVY